MQPKSILLIGLMGAISGAFGAWSCSIEESNSEVTQGHNQGHNLIIDGIPHAHGADNADRLCQNCHGLTLQGGEKTTVPSCYKCHGQNWKAGDSSNSSAPSDHSVLNGIYLHQTNLKSPVGTCDSCHGSQLEGTDTLPSCYLCHDKNW